MGLSKSKPVFAVLVVDSPNYGWVIYRSNSRERAQTVATRRGGFTKVVLLHPDAVDERRVTVVDEPDGSISPFYAFIMKEEL